MRPAPVSALLLFLGALGCGAQPSTSPQSGLPALSMRSELVLVPAFVQTRSGEPAFTLKDSDFTVTDDGVAQETTLDAETGGEPMALVIAVETGGSGAAQLDKYRELGTLIDNLFGAVHHRVAVVAFDSAPRLIQKFSSNPAETRVILSDLQAGDTGAAILDSLIYSVQMLRRQPPEYRRAILLLSESVDHGSQAKLEEAMRALSDTNTAIYAFGFSSAKSEVGSETARIVRDPNPGPTRGCMARDAGSPGGNRMAQAWGCLGLLAPPLRLLNMAAMLGMDGPKRNIPEAVAHLSGGVYFHLGDERAIQRDLLDLAHQIPNRYVLSFYPQSPHPGLHVIGVRLKDYPDLVVIARNGYWVDEAPKSAAPAEGPPPR